MINYEIDKEVFYTLNGEDERTYIWQDILAKELIGDNVMSRNNYSILIGWINGGFDTVEDLRSYITHYCNVETVEHLNKSENNLCCYFRDLEPKDYDEQLGFDVSAYTNGLGYISKKPMPTKLLIMLDDCLKLAQCGYIRSYYDTDNFNSGNDYDYADSVDVFNFFSILEEVCSMLFVGDVESAAEYIRKEGFTV